MIIDISEDGYTIVWTSMVTGERKNASIVQLIDALEAEPRAQGHWVVDYETEAWAIVCCDQCHEGMWNKKGDPYPNYCFNCGAKMDEVE